MRRVLKRNAGVDVSVGVPQPTQEKYHVYCRYLQTQHDDKTPADFSGFVSFLYTSPTDTLEISYRRSGRLVGVGIVDRVPTGLSSVYMYFDPQLSRLSPGTFSILWEIQYCRTLALPFYYLGYYVANCPSMSYKARYRPNEILDPSHRWVSFYRAAGLSYPHPTPPQTTKKCG